MPKWNTDVASSCLFEKLLYLMFRDFWVAEPEEMKMTWYTVFFKCFTFELVCVIRNDISYTALIEESSVTELGCTQPLASIYSTKREYDSLRSLTKPYQMRCLQMWALLSTSSITETNEPIYATVTVTLEALRYKVNDACRGIPQWRRRLEAEIKFKPNSRSSFRLMRTWFRQWDWGS